MRHASLFSGIGGFDLAAEWMGWENVFQVEKDNYCNKVLAKNFPQTKRYGDIKEFDGSKYRGAIDILTGGFPCQPYSVAGKRKGNEDDRHLWPENLRIIGEVQPPFVVGENVRGLLNWNEGLVFEQVQSDLENSGYEVTSFLLPACSVNAPHRRDRVWFLAYSDVAWKRRNERKEEIKENATAYASCFNGDLSIQQRIQNKTCYFNAIRPPEKRTFTNTNTERLQRCQVIGSIGSIWKNGRKQSSRFIRPDWQNFPTQSPICGRNDGIPNRMDRLKGLGNAIVPQVAYQIFKAIKESKSEH